jgi:hypothetical protein
MTIYTAIFGPYDDLKEPFVITPGWRYICYTDQDFQSDVWEIRKVPVMDCGPAKTARYYKIMPHKHIEDELTIWIDGTFAINTDLNEWWKRFTAPFTAVKHPFDNCIYTDAQACIDSGRGEKDLLQRQIALYKAIGVKRNKGLIASGVLMRQRCGVVNQFCNTWWSQVLKWSNRDQIAYGFANHQHPDVINLTEWNYTTENEFIHVPHLNRSWRKHVLNEMKRTNGKFRGLKK